MLRISADAGPTAVGLNSTLTVSVFFLASMKMPLLETEKGGSRTPIMTCSGNLPLFLTLTVFFLVALTFTLPKPRLPETLKVPTGVAVAVAVGVIVRVALAVAVAVEVAVAVAVGVTVALEVEVDVAVALALAVEVEVAVADAVGVAEALVVGDPEAVG